MTETQPQALTLIKGGRRGFHLRCAQTWLYAAILQKRFSRMLNHLGEPGGVRWDPFKGEVELRAHCFRAEQIGSFDGESWFWAWANPYLDIPKEKSTLSRALCQSANELKLPAFKTPCIMEADERIPYLMGDLTLGHSSAEAYYIANRAQVYAILPGQILPPPRDLLGEVQQALQERHNAPLPFEPIPALSFAAERLGLHFSQRNNQLLISGSNDDMLDLQLTDEGHLLQRVALCFIPPGLSIKKIRHLLESTATAAECDIKSSSVSDMTLEGLGFMIRLSYTDVHNAIIRERAVMGLHQSLTKDFSALITVECALTDEYSGTKFGVFKPSLISTTGAVWSPAQVNEIGGEPSPFVIPGEALAISKALSELEGTFVYDSTLERPYSRRQQ